MRATGTITLELTLEEASFLRALVRHVEGCPHRSPRRMSDAMDRALSEAGVPIAKLRAEGQIACEDSLLSHQPLDDPFERHGQAQRDLEDAERDMEALRKQRSESQ